MGGCFEIKKPTLYISGLILYYLPMNEKQLGQPKDLAAEPELNDIFSAGGKLEVTAVATERPGVYELHGSVLTRRFVKMSEAFPDLQTTPIEWC